MSDPNRENQSADQGEVITVSDGEGNTIKEFEVVNSYENDAHPGTFIIEVKEVEK